MFFPFYSPFFYPPLFLPRPVASGEGIGTMTQERWSAANAVLERGGGCIGGCGWKSLFLTVRQKRRVWSGCYVGP